MTCWLRLGAWFSVLVRIYGSYGCGPWVECVNVFWSLCGDYNTILNSRAPSTRHLYALKWKLFASWCRQCNLDPVHCPVCSILEFPRVIFLRGLAPATLKVMWESYLLNMNPWECFCWMSPSVLKLKLYVGPHHSTVAWIWPVVCMFWW